MGPIAATQSVFRNYVVMDGRASPSEYWWWSFVYFAVTVISMTIAVLAVNPSWPPLIAIINGALFIPFMLATIVPSLTLTVRRLHDTGRSGFWFFINFVPVIGAIWFLILLILPSQGEDNRFGPPPFSGEAGPARGKAKRAKKADIYNRTDVSNAYVAAFTTDPRARPAVAGEPVSTGGITDAELRASAQEFHQQRKAEISDYYKSKVLGGLKPDEPSYS